MAYDEALAERVDAAVGDRDGISDRKMFGGIAWMLAGNMACAVIGGELLARVSKEEYGDALDEPRTREFGMPGRRPMTGFVAVAPQDDDELRRWVERGLAYAASLPPKG